MPEAVTRPRRTPPYMGSPTRILSTPRRVRHLARLDVSIEPLPVVDAAQDVLDLPLRTRDQPAVGTFAARRSTRWGCASQPGQPVRPIDPDSARLERPTNPSPDSRLAARCWP